MQLKKISLPLTVLATTSVPTILHAGSTDSISLTQMKYVEDDDRIEIDFTLLDFKKDFGTDYSLGVSLSYDAISGGTPVWDSVSGGSSVQTSDTTSGASPCIDSTGKYICKDTRTKNIVGDGQVTQDDHVYRNIDIVDTRKAASTNLTIRTKSRDEISLGLAYSEEEDFASKEASLGYLYNLDSSRNRTIAAGISYQANDAYFYRTDDWKNFNIVNFQIGYTQVFTKKTVGQINIFGIKQRGVLTNPYKIIVRKFDVSLTNVPYYKYYLSTEKRPDEKNSAGITANLVSKVLPNVSLQGYYRFYNDSWGVVSNTVTVNGYLDFGDGWTLSPLIRYYQQEKANFYKGPKDTDYTFNETDYGSADARLSAFDSVTYNIGLKKKIKKGLKVKGFVASQYQSYGLQMTWVHIGVVYDL
jgi:hypothetical protein